MFSLIIILVSYPHCCEGVFNKNCLCVIRLVPVLAIKCTMADKSTKTDESLLNGDLESTCPTTTNAATMTTVVTCESPVRPTQVSVTTSTSVRTTHVTTQAPRPDLPKQPSTPPPPLVCATQKLSLSNAHQFYTSTC